MTINHLNANSVFNLTEIPQFSTMEEITYNSTLHPELVKDKTLDIMERDFQLKYPSVYRSFKEQQTRDLIEFIKVYTSNHGEID